MLSFQKLSFYDSFWKVWWYDPLDGKTLACLPTEFFCRRLANMVPASADTPFPAQAGLAAGELVRVAGACAFGQLRRQALDPFCLAQRIYGPSYVSMESALAFHGWIPEAVYATTSVCLKKSRSYDTPFGFFQYSSIPQRVLFAGVARLVSGTGEVFFMASPIKALADYVHIREMTWAGLASLVENLRIDSDAFASLVAEDFEVVASNSTSARVRMFLSAMRKELGL